jgi:hypothetical protein
MNQPEPAQLHVAIVHSSYPDDEPEPYKLKLASWDKATAENALIRYVEEDLTTNVPGCYLDTSSAEEAALSLAYAHGGLCEACALSVEAPPVWVASITSPRGTRIVGVCTSWQSANKLLNQWLSKNPTDEAYKTIQECEILS